MWSSDDDDEVFNTKVYFSGVTESEQQNMFKILASILHLGNIDLTAEDHEASDDGENAYINVSIVRSDIYPLPPTPQLR